MRANDDEQLEAILNIYATIQAKLTNQNGFSRNTDA
jgi:hypothetical protein